MNTPIFDQLKAERGIDPLEGAETFPKYKVSRDLEHGGWAVLKGEWIGFYAIVYQPYARNLRKYDARQYAECLNKRTEGNRP